MLLDAKEKYSRSCEKGKKYTLYVHRRSESEGEARWKQLPEKRLNEVNAKQNWTKKLKYVMKRDSVAVGNILEKVEKKL